MGNSKNTLNTTLKKMGLLDKNIVFSVLIILMILVCDLLVTLVRELGRPFFLLGYFWSHAHLSLMHVYLHKVFKHFTVKCIHWNKDNSECVRAQFFVIRTFWFSFLSLRRFCSRVAVRRQATRTPLPNPRQT
jgi:hypothetical protein